MQRAALPKIPLVPAKAGTQERSVAGAHMRGERPIALWSRSVQGKPMRLVLIVAAATMALGASARADPPTNATREPHVPTADQLARLKWIYLPSMSDVMRFYPPEATEHHASGRVVLSCQIAPNGDLSGCQVFTEAPPGYGFAKAALQLARRYRVDMREDGASLVGATIKVPFTWIDPNRW